MIQVFIFLVVMPFIFGMIGLLLVRAGVSVYDSESNIQNAVAEYLQNANTFDISQYPELTEEDINSYIKTLSQSEIEELQKKCNDNIDSSKMKSQKKR